MKKVFITLLALLALVATSCVNDSKKDTIVTAQPVMYTLALTPDNSQVHFSTLTHVLSINYTQNTIAVEGGASPDGSETVYFKSPDMELKVATNYNALAFSCPSISANNGTQVTNLNGLFDINTGFVYLTYEAAGRKFYSTPMLVFPYCSTTSTEVGNSPYLDDETQIFFTINKEKMTATMMLANLHLSSTLAATAPIQLQYNNIPVTVTTEGYRIEAERLDPQLNTDSGYTLLDFKTLVKYDGLSITSSFICKDHTVTLTGKMFQAK